MLIHRDTLEIRVVACREKTRYAINGLLFERRQDGKARVVATDGKRLAYAEWDDAGLVQDWIDASGPPLSNMPKDEKRIFQVCPVDFLQKLVKSLPKAKDVASVAGGIFEHVYLDEAHLLEQDEFRFVVHSPGGGTSELKCKPIEGHFPPYEEVIPARDSSVFAVGLNADFLAELVTAQTKARGGGSAKDAAAYVGFRGIDAAILVEAGHSERGVDTRGVIMPINLSEGGKDFPQVDRKGKKADDTARKEAIDLFNRPTVGGDTVALTTRIATLEAELARARASNTVIVEGGGTPSPSPRAENDEAAIAAHLERIAEVTAAHEAVARQLAEAQKEAEHYQHLRVKEVGEAEVKLKAALEDRTKIEAAAKERVEYFQKKCEQLEEKATAGERLAAKLERDRLSVIAAHDETRRELEGQKLTFALAKKALDELTPLAAMLQEYAAPADEGEDEARAAA